MRQLSSVEKMGRFFFRSLPAKINVMRVAMGSKTDVELELPQGMRDQEISVDVLQRQSFFPCTNANQILQPY